MNEHQRPVAMDELIGGMQHRIEPAQVTQRPAHAVASESPATPTRVPQDDLPPAPRRWADELDAADHAIAAPSEPRPAGWRRVARRIGLPVAVEPPKTALMRDCQDAARAWPEVKTITVANPKGGSGKTPLAIVLAQAFSQCRGGGVGLMDNNPTGTAGERLAAPLGRPATIEDVVEVLDHLERHGARANDLLHYLRYQPDGNIRALLARTRATRRDATGRAQLVDATINQVTFRRLWSLLARHFQPLIIDSGNNDADQPWLGAMAVTDQLVVPVRWDRDHCRPATQMLASLQESPLSHLAEQAIIVATWPPDEKVSTSKATQYASQFERWGNEVLQLPPDPHIQERGPIRWSHLTQRTQTAALHLAGTIARRLA